MIARLETGQLRSSERVVKEFARIVQNRRICTHLFSFRVSPQKKISVHEALKDGPHFATTVAKRANFTLEYR